MKILSESNYEIFTLPDLIQYLNEHDNTVDNFHMAAVDDTLKERDCMLGIDEAGRGPVLGPMVYGMACCPINAMDMLCKLNCADSKTLNESQRNDIFLNICKENMRMTWAVHVISPNTICNNMLSRNKVSLNRISMDAAVGLIRKAVDAGINLTHVYVDTVGKPEVYQSYLKELFPKLHIKVEKKADSTFPIVSAASICAKVTRDHALQNWVYPEGYTMKNDIVGSGYTSDATTRNFLVQNCDPVFGFSQMVRFSWSTVEVILRDHGYHIEFDGDVNDQNASKAKKTKLVAADSNSSITSFFKFTPTVASGAKHKTKIPHAFFTQRHLSRNVEF